MLFNVYIRKRAFDGHEFGNRYVVRANDLAAASVWANAIVVAERAIHSGAVTFVFSRTSSFVTDDEVFTTVPLSGTGTSGGVGDLLPAVLCVRVDFQVDGGGRPSRKFYHACLNEGNQNAGQWSSDVTTLFDTVLGTLVASGTGTEGLVDVDGAALTAAVTLRPVTTHQWSKRSRRRTP